VQPFNVRFGYLADPLANISLMSASEGKADVKASLDGVQVDDCFRPAMLGRQTLLEEVVYPPDPLVNIVGCALQGAGAQRNYASATIGRVLPFG